MSEKLKFYITGDTHGQWGKLKFLKDLEDFSAAVIILGDFGANYAHDQMENSRKDALNSYHNYIYAVRGNHDDRPEDLEGVSEFYDENVGGYVLCQKRRWPNIRYLKDGGEYLINGYKVLVIGGAYSVDKEYRLLNSLPFNPKELLTKEEMDKIFKGVKGKSYDFVLTHTCPFSWQPTDLFLSFIDQSKVDKTMEEWFTTVEENIEYQVWLFGHFHDDRLVRPHVEMMYNDVQSLEEVYERWQNDFQPYMYTWNIDPKFEERDNYWGRLNGK